jgi:hypothetical protein
MKGALIMNALVRLAVAGIAALVTLPALSQGPAFSRQALGAESRPGVRSAAAPHALAVGAVSHLLLPTSANVTGNFNAVFKTKVSIFNAVDATYQIRLGLSAASGEIDFDYLTIQPFETVTFNNILQDVFGYYGGGAIDLNSNNGDHVFIVSSQVYVDTAAGRYTTAVQFADELGAIVPSRPGFVVGVSVNGSSRTNIGCASNSAYDQTITFQAYDADGFTVGSPFSFTLMAWGWGQVGYTGSLTNGGVRIQATQNAVCYGVEVNNVSNDGTFQLATPF